MKSDLLNALNKTAPQPPKGNVKPDELPIPGDPAKMWGIYIWGVPNLVGSPKIPMPCLFTAVDPETGRANGWAFSDPSMKTDDGRGNLTQFPPLVPFEGAPYTKTPEKGHWMHRDEFLAEFNRISEKLAKDKAAREGKGV